MFYDRRWITLTQREMGFLIIAVISWIFLSLIKSASLVYTESLSLPFTIFWSGMGMGISLFIFNVLVGLRLPLSKIFFGNFKELLLAFFPAICGLIAIELYFYYQGEEPLYFYLWVPILTLALLIIFLSPRKKLIRIRLFIVAIAAAFAIFHAGKIDIPIVSTLFLVGFILLTRLGIKKGTNSLQILLMATILKGITSSFYSLLTWQSGGVIEMKPLYYALGGGCFMGLSLLFFMKSLEEVRMKELFFLSAAPLLTRIKFPEEILWGVTPYLIAGGLVALSTILTRLFLKETSLPGKL